MDAFIARANIEHFRRLLATETSAEKRELLLRLLAEEEAKLKTANATANERKQG